MNFSGIQTRLKLSGVLFALNLQPKSLEGEFSNYLWLRW